MVLIVRLSGKKMAAEGRSALPDCVNVPGSSVVVEGDLSPESVQFFGRRDRDRAAEAADAAHTEGMDQGGVSSSSSNSSNKSSNNSSRRQQQHNNARPPPRGAGAGAGAGAGFGVDPPAPAPTSVPTTRGRGRGRKPGQGHPGRHRNERAPGQHHHQQQQQGGGRARLVSECGEDSCPVCLNKMRIFAVGMCNHHVCSECSTRMRVLGAQNECPICRQDLPKVIHTETRRDFADVEKLPFKIERKFRICFENEAVEMAFQVLLQHKCKICAEDEDQDVLFRTFKELENHMKRTHERFYCELCREHLTIFTHERRFYNRHDLALHRRKGDTDDTSHRGHPLCEFCQTRFVDKDELFRHLRRDHFYCHFCDADGLQHFYPDYDSLRDHFREEHFLCEEGDCLKERFTHAFRSEMDLKGHVLEAHANGLSKAEAKQNRVVDLDLNYARPSNDQARRRRGLDADGGDAIDGAFPRGQGNGNRSQVAPVYSAEQFPTLSGAPVSAVNTGAGRGGQKWSNGGRLANVEEEFPSLPGAPMPASSFSSGGARRRDAPVKQQSQPKSSTPASRPEDFPTLGGASKGLSSTFRPAQQEHYRQLQAPAWSDSDTKKTAVVGRISKVAPAPDIDSEKKDEPAPFAAKMTTLTKQKKKPQMASLVSEQDFPGLEAKRAVDPSAPQTAPEKDKKSKSKKKKKGMGHFLLENLDNSEPEKPTTASLQSAADLIFKEQPPEKKVERVEELWTKVEAKPKPTPKVDKDSIPPGLDLGKLTLNGSQQLAPPPGLTLVSSRNGNAAEDFPSLGKSKEVKTGQIKGPAEAVEDFPSLGKSATKMSAHFRPVSAPASSSVNASSSSAGWSTSKLGNCSNSSSGSAKPPPGFTVKASTKAPPPGFKRGGSASTSNYTYSQPLNFNQRNVQLLSTLTALLGGKSLEFANFKKLSASFRADQITCADFHRQGLEILEEDKFCQMFPELLFLLPDIKKQQDLLVIHTKKFPKEARLFRTCDICDQVLGSSDYVTHKDTHSLDSDFPRLG